MTRSTARFPAGGRSTPTANRWSRPRSRATSRASARRNRCPMLRPNDELCRLTATEAVVRRKRREITPLDLIEAAAGRIAEVEPAINALPTLCIERARAHAERLVRGEGRAAEAEPGWLAGLPVAIQDLAAVAGGRQTHG